MGTIESHTLRGAIEKAHRQLWLASEFVDTLILNPEQERLLRKEMDTLRCFPDSPLDSIVTTRGTLKVLIHPAAPDGLFRLYDSAKTTPQFVAEQVVEEEEEEDIPFTDLIEEEYSIILDFTEDEYDLIAEAAAYEYLDDMAFAKRAVMMGAEQVVRARRHKQVAKK